MIRGSGVDGKGTDSLVHATVDAAAPGLCNIRNTLRRRFIILIDGGEGGAGLRIEIRGGLLRASRGGGIRLVMRKG